MLEADGALVKPARKPRVRKARPPKPPKPVVPKKVFVEDTILSLHREEGKNYSEELRIVVWVVDGVRKSPRLERREKTFDEDTKRVKRSKAKGLLWSDMQIIAEKAEAIHTAFVSELERPANGKPKAKPEPATTNGFHHPDSPFV